jgi:hypothetical protein
MSIPLKKVEHYRYLTNEFASRQITPQSELLSANAGALWHAGRGRGAERNAGSRKAAITHFDSSHLTMAFSARREPLDRKPLPPSDSEHPPTESPITRQMTSITLAFLYRKPDGEEADFEDGWCQWDGW